MKQSVDNTQMLNSKTKNLQLAHDRYMHGMKDAESMNSKKDRDIEILKVEISGLKKEIEALINKKSDTPPCRTLMDPLFQRPY